MYSHILSIILFTPLVGAVILLFVPKENTNAIRWLGNIFAMIGFAVSLPLVPWFWAVKDQPGFKFLEGGQNNWIPTIGAGYSLGIDGISFLLIMLTTLLGAISILSSWEAIQVRVKEYYIWFLILQTGMLGVFMALDLFLFFVFWEAMLVPMYLLIGIWGGPRKLYAAIKFFLYTLAGSVLMLLGILFLYFFHHTRTGVYTFDLLSLYRTAPQIPAVYGDAAGVILFLGFFIGFAIKVPMFLAAIFPVGDQVPGVARMAGRSVADRHHLRRAGFADAKGYEETGGVLVREPPRLLHPRYFRVEPGRHRRFRHTTD
jgi:NADH-quinone oxidoreductase subunit M